MISPRVSSQQTKPVAGLAGKHRVKKKPKAKTSPQEPSIHVALVSPEIAPFAKTGGLGDMVAALSRALERLGLRVSLVMPAYRSVLQGGFPLQDTGVRFTVPVSDRMVEGGLLKTNTGSAITVYFVRAVQYFDRDYLYGTPESDYPDNAERFIFFSRAALEVLKMDPPEILHAHDWQSAPCIVFLKAQPDLYPQLSTIKTVLTVHNLGYQGLFWYLDWHLLNLDWSFYTPSYLEFYGRINFLKGGFVFADAITAVSPTYAEEIKTAEHGFGLEGVFRERAPKLVGIPNGADYDVWNPKKDPLIARTYDADSLSEKMVCKVDLQRAFQLPERADVPLIGMVSRLTPQKGLDLLEKALDELFSRDIQFVFLGTGDKRYQDFLARLALQHPTKCGVRIAFDESLAHKVIAGADMFLVPSRYEPSGLTQLYSLKYGTIPVVRATGGLRDTIREFNPETGEGNGFVFSLYKSRKLLEAVVRALTLFNDRAKWVILMKNAMAADFSWGRSARAYLNLYQKLLVTERQPAKH
jgi:starch synthase